MELDGESPWLTATTATALAAAGKMVLELGGAQVLLLWNDGSPVAMDDVCIHRGRSLSDGVLLNQRIICAGHQWAFELATGYCRARDRFQPVHEVRVEDGAVLVARPAPVQEGDIEDVRTESIG